MPDNTPSTPLEELADALHTSTCHWNHTDYCAWFYEDWTGWTHRSYLLKAQYLLEHGGPQGLSDILRTIQILKELHQISAPVR